MMTTNTMKVTAPASDMRHIAHRQCLPVDQPSLLPPPRRDAITTGPSPCGIFHTYLVPQGTALPELIGHCRNQPRQWCIGDEKQEHDMERENQIETTELTDEELEVATGGAINFGSGFGKLGVALNAAQGGSKAAAAYWLLFG
jgi:hypothetical protein